MWNLVAKERAANAPTTRADEGGRVGDSWVQFSGNMGSIGDNSGDKS